METLTIEQQVREALTKRGIDILATLDLKSIRLINRIFRDNDDSDLYPIYGEFNVTERAIRFYRRVMLPANGPCSNLEYIYGLEGKISEIVNNV